MGPMRMGHRRMIVLMFVVRRQMLEVIRSVSVVVRHMEVMVTVLDRLMLVFVAVECLVAFRQRPRIRSHADLFPNIGGPKRRSGVGNSGTRSRPG